MFWEGEFPIVAEQFFRLSNGLARGDAAEQIPLDEFDGVDSSIRHFAFMNIGGRLAEQLCQFGLGKLRLAPPLAKQPA
jgi:hypothetical protein